MESNRAILLRPPTKEGPLHEKYGISCRINLSIAFNMQIFPYAVFQPIKPHIDVTDTLTSGPGLLLQCWCVDDLTFQNFPKLREHAQTVTKTKLEKVTFYLAHKCLWASPGFDSNYINVAAHRWYFICVMY